jgi:hypothetical protein
MFKFDLPLPFTDAALSISCRASTVYRQAPRILLIAATVLLQSLSAQVENDDFQAIRAITAFKGSDFHIGNVRTKVMLTSFGQYERSGECDNFRWELDFNRGAVIPIVGAPTVIKDRLHDAVVASITTGRRFDAAYAPVNNWLLVTLPAFASRFDTASTELLAYSEQGQTEKMAELIGNLDKEIAGMEKELQDGFISLTQFSKDLQTARDVVDRGLRDKMEALFKRQEKSLNEEVRTGRPIGFSDVKTPSDHGRAWPACAQKAALDSFVDYTTTFRDKFNMINSELANATGGGTSAHWMPHILTRIVEIQRRYETVRTRLKNVQTAPGGAVQELRILTAQLAAGNLAKYARGALQQ